MRLHPRKPASQEFRARPARRRDRPNGSRRESDHVRAGVLGATERLAHRLVTRR